MQTQHGEMQSKHILCVSLDSGRWSYFVRLRFFFLGLVYCSQEPQIRNLAKSTLKLGLTVLFTHLKIILYQCFQFSVFNFQQ